LKTATAPAAAGLDHITDPDQAVEFAELTGVDALAIAIGTSHGAYKFTKKPDGSVLKMDVLIAIHKRLPNTHLVMHGSSSVPKDLQDVINQYGGKLKETWGVPVEEIQLGIRNGVRKINVDTDNRLAMTGAIRKVFAETPEKFDPRDYMKPAREAMKKVVAQRMTQFGQAGHAGDYKPVPITEIAKGYADGTLFQAVQQTAGRREDIDVPQARTVFFIVLCAVLLGECDVEVSPNVLDIEGRKVLRDPLVPERIVVKRNAIEARVVHTHARFAKIGHIQEVQDSSGWVVHCSHGDALEDGVALGVDHDHR
jgi:hypothetical protein